MALTDPRPVALVLRALALGDLLVAVPALRGIRAALPGHRIVLAAPAAVAAVVALSGALDATVDVRGLDAGPEVLEVGAIEVAVNLHGSGPQSHHALLARSPRRLVAFAHPEWTGPGPAADAPPWREDEHEVVRWCRLVGACLGPCDPGDLALAVPGVVPAVRSATVLHPGAGYGSRRWPVERWARVARELRAAGHAVVVTGSASERAGAESVADAAGLGPEAVLAGRTSLLELAALVAAARLVVSGDTGVAHLATAYARPSVVLFGPAPPARWGPPARDRHVVLWRGDPRWPWRSGDVFGDTPDPVLLALGPDDVLAGCSRALSGSVRP